jgi:hypothetical protein
VYPRQVVAVRVNVEVQSAGQIVRDDALLRGWGEGAKQKLGSCAKRLPR